MNQSTSRDTCYAIPPYENNSHAPLLRCVRLIIVGSTTPGDVAVHLRSIALLAVACGAPAAHAQQDAGVARDIAANCAGCHGTNGVSQGGVPSLAGQSKPDLVRKMQDFKAGRTPSTVMTQLAKGYTDEQIDLAAGFFAAQKR